MVVGELAQGDGRGDGLALLQGQQVGDVGALGLSGALGHLVNLDLVHASQVGEQDQMLVVGGDQEGVDEVAVPGLDAGDAFAAAALLLVVGEAHAFDVAPL